MAADRFTYERAEISGWLTRNGTSQMTGETLPHRNVMANAALRAIINSVR